MMLVVWLIVGIGSLLLLAVLGYALFGQFKRLGNALTDAQSAVAPQVAALSEGIRRAQMLRMQDGSDTNRGHGRHA